MRLLRSAQLVLGLAIGGGLVLALSNSAFAADGSAGTASQTVTQVTSSQTNDTAVSKDAVPAKAVDRSTVSVSVLTTTKKTDALATPVTPASAAPTDPGTNTSDKPGVAGPIKSVQETVNAPAAGVVSDTPAVRAEAAQPVSQVEPVAAPARAVVPAVTGLADTSIPVRHSAQTEVPVYHTVVLPVQPMITNSRPVVMTDLASALPSARPQQDPARVPAPSQPSGLLGALTAQLAGVVVPAVFSTPLLDFVGLTLAYTLLILASMLATGRFISSFGLWLRRGGYAHAARSDVPVAAFTPLFATPFALSFVTAYTPARSSFLVVSDTKTILFVSPMLLERRK